jgi:hypothetical protein
MVGLEEELAEVSAGGEVFRRRGRLCVDVGY